MMLLPTARGVGRAGAWLATASALAVVPLAAAAQSTARVDVSVGALTASDPYMRAGADNGAEAVSLTLRPYVSINDDTTTATLDGSLNLERYIERYGTDLSAQIGAMIDHRVNERTTVSAQAGFSSSETAARHFYGGPDLGGLEPGEFPDSPVIDPTLGSIKGRTSRLDVGLSLQQLVSANGTLSLTSGIGVTQVDSGAGADYRDVSTGLSYSRRLDARTSLVTSAQFSYADYFGRRAGDGMIVTALAGVDHQFSESLHGSVQVGMSYADVKSLLAGRDNVTDWASTVNLCDTSGRGTLCATGSRAARPTSLGGVTSVTSVRVSYAHPIGNDGNLSLSASYSKAGSSGSSPTLVMSRESEVASINGSYRHRIGERLAAFVTPSYSSSDDEIAGEDENYQVLVGVSYRFGQTQ